MIFSANHAFQVYYKVYLWKVYHEYISYHGSMTMTLDSDKTSFYFDQASSSHGYITLKLVYLNGNNAAEGENNMKYVNSYPMN